jgi:hypothetical protein
MRFLECARAHGLVLSLVGALAFSSSAQAGLWDSLFGSGKTEAKQADAVSPSSLKRRSWRIGDFVEVRLSPSEPGSDANAHPATLNAEALRQMLAAVRTTATGSDQALFATSELDDLLEPLQEAFLAAGPKDDVMVLSSHRRSGGILSAPTAVTARLFIQATNLNLVVNDARFEFFHKYRGTGRPPEFIFGSRALASSQAALQRPGAVSRRADWLEIPLKSGDALAAPAAQLTAPQAAAAPAVPITQAVVPARAATETSDEFERRLSTLKRLRDKGLISEDEYQEKRKLVMQRL